MYVLGIVGRVFFRGFHGCTCSNGVSGSLYIERLLFRDTGMTYLIGSYRIATMKNVQMYGVLKINDEPKSARLIHITIK